MRDSEMNRWGDYFRAIENQPGEPREVTWKYKEQSRSAATDDQLVSEELGPARLRRRIRSNSIAE